MRFETLLSYLESVEENVGVLANGRSIRAALIDFSDAFEQFSGTEAETSSLLQEAYTTNDRSGIPDILAGENASILNQYIGFHREHHNWFELIISDLGYYDVFLIDPLGNIVYTVTKEKDFGTNLLTGPWRESGLAAVFKGAMKRTVANNDLFADFAPYGPSNDEPAAFLAKPVFSGTEKVGVFAIQMPIDRINDIMFIQAGLGTTGQTYLVGDDYFMRTQSRLTGEQTILRRTVSSSAALSALSGNAGYDQVSDYRGIPVFSSYRPFRFLGVNWAILSEIDVSEAEEPIDELRDNVVTTASIGSVIIILLGTLFARTITTPLVRLGNVIRNFGETREKTPVPYTNREDELGDISRAFAGVEDQVTDYLHKIEQADVAIRANADQFRSMLDTGSVAVVITRIRDRVLLYANPRFAEMTKFSLDEIVGKPATDFYANADERDFIKTLYGKEGYVEDLEVEVKKSDGDTFIALLSMHPIEFEGEPANMVWAYDITKRKLSESELEDRTQQIELLQQIATLSNKAATFEDAIALALSAV